MKTIIEMALEAGAAVGSPALGAPEIIFPQCLDVQRFAALVRADEREACAKVVDAIEVQCIAEDVDDLPLRNVAAAIRARGNT